MSFSNGIFYSASDYYKKIFGKKVYKVSLDAGCTCPTRDGTLGTGGCIFCSYSGSGDFASDSCLSIPEQIKNGISLVENKIKSPAFIAYFQNFTNTYGDADALYEKYCQALEAENVVGLSIATRPDCLSNIMLEKLAVLSENNFVTVELGFQTSKESSANYIRRGYKNEIYLDAVKRLKEKCINIHIVTHLIFGLPGETEADMLNSVRFVVNAETDGIKISLLHVLKGTDLANDYEKKLFRTLEMNEYFGLISEALKIIPEKTVIHRLTGDGAKKILIAPLWSGNKKNVCNSMLRYFREKRIVQGMNYAELR